MLRRTLCNCLVFSEAEYRHGFVSVRIRAHYKANPECAKKAKEDLVWKMRKSIERREDIGDEHDPFYDTPIQQNGLQPI